MWYDTTVDPDGPISFGFYDGFDPTDPNHYYFTGVQGSYKQPTTDKIWNGRIDVSREVDLGLIRAIRFGGTYQDRTLATVPNAMPSSAAGRLEGRRVGKEWVSPCRTRWSAEH